MTKNLDKFQVKVEVSTTLDFEPVLIKDILQAMFSHYNFEPLFKISTVEVVKEESQC